MNSIRTKTTLLTVCAIVISMTIATLLSVTAIRNLGNSNSEEMLLLLCETGEKNLDSYFDSVEQSVELVSTFAQEDLGRLDSLEPAVLEAHMQRTEEIFEKAARKTNGVLTYYYRIDPAISDTAKGFWYTDLDGSGFAEHEVTDISLYDTADTSSLVWFTVPKSTGEPIWLPPYITDNLNVRVISYNEPIYWRDTFIGVVGIEIDYTTMAEQVDHIKLYDNGYAFLNDAAGTIIYHPRMDVTVLSPEEMPKVPKGLLSDDAFIRYSFDGVEKQAVWLPLSNGMRLNVTVPVSEVNGNWQQLIAAILIVSVVLLIVFVLLTMRFTGHITKPLRELTEVAKEVNRGNYDFELASDASDEVGILTRAVDQLIRHLKVYITDLNNLAYADALTSVHNKGAYDISLQKLENELTMPGDKPEFALGLFDCDDLKVINDRFGHDKGDLYLKSASALICSVFQHSAVFRTGGDEFAVILRGDDFKNREELVRLFEETSAEICAFAETEWEQVRVAMGVAVYDPFIDRTVEDVARRADQLMYENKRSRKVGRESE